MKKRGLDNCKKAVQLYRSALTRDPDNIELKLELADALNAVMRIQTHANTLLIEGSLDTPANKKIWRELGEEAIALAKPAYAKAPNDVRAPPDHAARSASTGAPRSHHRATSAHAR